jgi:hypothetical protein
MISMVSTRSQRATKSHMDQSLLAPVSVFAGDKDEGRTRLRVLHKCFPGLTISEVRAGLPHTTEIATSFQRGSPLWACPTLNQTHLNTGAQSILGRCL